MHHERKRELARRIIGRDRDPGFYRALKAMGLPVERRHVSVLCDDDGVQLAALRAGAGIGICQAPVAARETALERILPELRLHIDAWVVTHEDLHGLPRIRAVFDAIAQELGRHAGPVAG